MPLDIEPVDSQSAFNRTLKLVSKIFFTHPHVLGASNLYRKLWNARIYLHDLDADQPLTKAFPAE